MVPTTRDTALAVLIMLVRDLAIIVAAIVFIVDTV
jgi:hypothetical protein